MIIYIIGFLVGILNGLFASGAGQVLVFYLIFIKKMETHMVRALSISILSISSRSDFLFLYSVFALEAFDEKLIGLAVRIARQIHLGKDLGNCFIRCLLALQLQCQSNIIFYGKFA